MDVKKGKEEKNQMNISKEEKKAEAIVRMKILGIFPETIQQFETDDKVSISEPPFGAFIGLRVKIWTASGILRRNTML